MSLLDAVKEKLFEKYENDAIATKAIEKAKKLGDLAQILYTDVFEILESMEVEKYWFK
jgi:hypothetical protein